MCRGIAVRHEQRDRRVREIRLLERDKVFVLGIIENGDFERGFFEGGNAQLPALCLSRGDVGFAGFKGERNVLDVRDLNRPLGSGSAAEKLCIKTKFRRLCLGRKAMTNLDSIFKSRDITLPTKVNLVKAVVLQ